MLWSFFPLVPDEDISVRAFRWPLRKYRFGEGRCEKEDGMSEFGVRRLLER